MKKIKVKDFNLDHTLSCGQVFRWHKHTDGFWYGFIDGELVKIKQVFLDRGDKLRSNNRSKEQSLSLRNSTLEYASKASASKIKSYFNLSLDYRKVIKSFPKDKTLSMAIKKYWGLRVIKQDPIECLLTYVLSSQNNIPRINKMVNELSRRLGKKVKFEGKEYFAFPKLKAIDGCSKHHINACRMGFRDKYLDDAVKKISNGEVNLKKLSNMCCPVAREELLKIKGVGPKIADCVLLFGFNKYEAFPVDVWIERIMKKYYKGKDGSYFGVYAGIAQEYLYMYIRGQKI
jgi:N-glycosylase/DNA lyase